MYLLTHQLLLLHLQECISQSAVETKFQQHTTNGKQIVRELHSMMEMIFESAVSQGYVDPSCVFSSSAVIKGQRSRWVDWSSCHRLSSVGFYFGYIFSFTF